MIRTVEFICSECGHAHECEIIQGETAYDDYAEVPEYCESCGSSTVADCGVNEQAAERRQMGIE